MMNYQDVANNWDTYDYETAVRQDVKEYLLENIGQYAPNTEELDDIRDIVLDDLVDEDSITGNASGSYTFSRMMAELYLVNNSYLYEEALEEFGGKFDPEPEHRDITIRMYLLPSALDAVLEDEDVIDAYKEAKGE